MLESAEERIYNGDREAYAFVHMEVAVEQKVGGKKETVIKSLTCPVNLQKQKEQLQKLPYGRFFTVKDLKATGNDFQVVANTKVRLKILILL